MPAQTPGRRRRKISPRKIIRYYGPVVLLICLGVVMCVPVRRTEQDGSEIRPDEAPVVQILKGTTVRDLEQTDTVTYHKRRLDEMPEPTQRIRVNYFGSERAYFNDSNHIHMAEAERYGIEPLTDTRSHWHLRRPIVKVASCADYYVDTLIFSRPYLVPEAAGRLREIGKRFRDTIQARGGGDYRIKVTSLLRTPQTVRRLRRRNRNAIDSSVHQLGTTFDISYAAFIAGSPEPARSVDDLKGILGEVLKAMREEGKLWVKYERGQPCFHITARPDSIQKND
ncbi:MAG: hypothetical protein K2F86_01855 [Duncaniella sp.]|nr:hypothetical protein [Duncaniella sp.]MDE6177897.1 hypothetical protein [Duncaniella sp.]